VRACTTTRSRTPTTARSGDPTDASAEKGEQLFRAATDQLVELAEWVETQPWAAIGPREHVREREASGGQNR